MNARAKIDIVEPNRDAFVTGLGQSDTHALEIDDRVNGGKKKNPHPQAGNLYKSISPAEIAALVERPDNREKNEAPWIIPSPYHEHDARGHGEQIEKGAFALLPVDIDKGNLSLEQVESALNSAFGGKYTYIIYSTSSASEDDKKWRIFFPLEDAVSGQDYKETQQALFNVLRNRGIECDAALERAGQLVFLPNVPPSKRDADGKPFFYQHKIHRAVRMPMDDSNVVYRRREAIRKDVEEAKELARQKHAKPLINIQTTGDDSPVDAFNANHSLRMLLEKYGYEQQGKSDHYRSPNQTSGSYAVRVYDETAWVSLSGSDANVVIGKAKGHCQWGDAFDLYVFYEHGGDYKAAVRAYGAEIRQHVTPAPHVTPCATNSDGPAIVEPPRVAGPVEAKTDGTPPDETLKDWAFLTADNVFMHRHTGEVMSVSAFNIAMARHTPLLAVENAKGETVTKKIPPTKFLTGYEDGLVVSNTMYRPDLDDEVFWVEGVKYLNSYSPRTTPKAASDWKDQEAWRTCRDHIRNILGSDAGLLIQWMAHNVQKPGKKILWAPIIVGVQGDGKTTISKIIAAAMGAKNVGTISMESLFSDFTSWAEGSAVRVLEEIRVKGHNRHDAMNKLKPVITNDMVEVVRKGKDGRQVVNVTNYMALTNHADALVLDEGDRRWSVFKTRFETRKDMLAELDSAYWENLHAAIEKHPEAIRGWLLDEDLTDFDRVAGPELTTYKRDMIERTKPDAQVEVEEVIAIGAFGVSEDLIATCCLNAEIKERSGQSFRTSRLSDALELAGFVKIKDTLKWKGKNRRLWRRKGAGLSKATPAELRRILDQTEVPHDSVF